MKPITDFIYIHKNVTEGNIRTSFAPFIIKIKTFRKLFFLVSTKLVIKMKLDSI